MLRNWRTLDYLGRGGFGNVYSASRAGTDDIFALKIVEFNSANPVHMKEVKALENEIFQLSSLDHPRIVKYYGSERYERSICVVMEYMPSGSLQDEIKANGELKEVMARKFTRQILEGLLYLHALKRVHRDIKCGNILLDSSKKNIKIADFGTCRQLPTLLSRGATSHTGSNYFMAPEIIRGEKYGRKADIWSLGCTIVEMLTGSPPWKDLEPEAAIYQIGISTTKPKYTLPEEISSGLREFLDILFTRDPKDRPSSEDALRQFDLSYPLENPNIWRQAVSQRSWTLLSQNLAVPNFATYLKDEGLISQAEYHLVLKKETANKQLVELANIVVAKDRFWVPLLQFLQDSSQVGLKKQLEEEYLRLEDEGRGHLEGLEAPVGESMDEAQEDINRILEQHIQQSNTEPRYITIVLLGKTGEGKSSTGNTLLARNEFPVDLDRRACTHKTEAKTADIDVDGEQYRLSIIDTPDLFDTSDQEIIKEEIQNCIEFNTQQSNSLTGSIHAFFLIMRTDSRFNDSMNKTLDVIAELFGGKHINAYLFICFTRADELSSNEMSEEEFMRTHVNDQILKKIEETNNDPIFVNNKLVKDLAQNESEIQEWRENVVRKVVRNLRNRDIIPYSYLHFSTVRIDTMYKELQEKLHALENTKNHLIEDLNAMEVEYRKEVKTGEICGVVGSSVSLGVGLPLMIAGIALAVPSFGTSLILTAAGTGVSLAGGVVSAGGSINVAVHNSKLGKKAKETIESFFQKFIEYEDMLSQGRHMLLDAKIGQWSALQPMKHDYGKPSNATQELWDVCPKIEYVHRTFLALRGISGAMNLFNGFAKVGLSVGTRAIPIIGAVTGAVFDAGNLAKSAHGLRTAEKTAADKFIEIREEINGGVEKMEAEMKELLAELEEFVQDPTESCKCAICNKLWTDPVLCPVTQMHVAGCQKCLYFCTPETLICPVCVVIKSSMLELGLARYRFVAVKNHYT